MQYMCCEVRKPSFPRPLPTQSNSPNPPPRKSHRTTTTVKLRDKESYQADGDNSHRDWAKGRRAGAPAWSPFPRVCWPHCPWAVGETAQWLISRDWARGAGRPAGGGRRGVCTIDLALQSGNQWCVARGVRAGRILQNTSELRLGRFGRRSRRPGQG